MEFIGKNCFKDLKSLIDNENFDRILLIVGSTSFEKSGAREKLESILEKRKKEILFKKKEYTDLSELIIAIDKISTFKPNLIITVGGGSVIDLAKISNCLVEENAYVEKIQNSSLELKKKYCKLVAVPTTAGSGAEVTSNAVLYINKIKYSVEGNLILPDFSFIDPELVMSVPKLLSASAGFDAMSQALESLLSVKSNDQSVKYAIKSLECSIDNLEQHINKQSFETATKMCNASFFSGKAINISKTTAPHAVSYPFTSFYGIKHGHAVSLTLCDFLSFNYQNLMNSKANFDLKHRFDLIFKSFKVNDIKDLNQKIEKILKNINLVSDLKKLKINKYSDVEKIVSNINSQRLKNNPVPLDVSKVKEILLKKI